MENEPNMLTWIFGQPQQNKMLLVSMRRTKQKSCKHQASSILLHRKILALSRRYASSECRSNDSRIPDV